MREYNTAEIFWWSGGRNDYINSAVRSATNKDVWVLPGADNLTTNIAIDGNSCYTWHENSYDRSGSCCLSYKGGAALDDVALSYQNCDSVLTVMCKKVKQAAKAVRMPGDGYLAAPLRVELTGSFDGATILADSVK